MLVSLMDTIIEAWDHIRYWSRWGNERCAKCGGKFDLGDRFSDGWAVLAAQDRGPLVHGRCK